MRRVSKSKRRKSENSSDAESGENGGNASKIEGIDLEKNNDRDEEDDEEPKAKRRSYSRGRDKSSNVDESNDDDDETASDSKQENGNSEKRKRKATTSEEVDENEEGEDDKTDKADKEEEESEEEDDYEVEKIVKQRIMKGRRQYLVRWKGYDASDDTWKNENELNCPQLVEDFLAREEDKSEMEVDENVKTPKKTTKAAPKSKKKATQKSAKAKKQTNDDDGEVNENGKSGKKARRSKSAKNDKRAKKENVEGESARDANEEFEVEKILEVQFKKNKSRLFLIRWKGFSAKDDTWEPEDNLNCPDLISKFMEKVEKAKSTDTKELRTNPSHTKRYTLAMHSSGRRLSRRNIDKQRMTYHECDD